MALPLNKIMKRANNIAAQLKGPYKDRIAKGIHRAYQELDTMNVKSQAEILIDESFQVIRKDGMLTKEIISDLALVEDMGHCQNIKRAVLRAIKGAIQIDGQLLDVNTYGVSLAIEKYYHDDSVAA